MELPLELLIPTNMAIEPTNHCNLRCPDCPHGSNEMTRPKGFMGYEQFCSLYDAIPARIYHLAMYYYGESCMHKDLWRMVSYTRRRYTALSTNGHYFRREQDREDCLDSGLSKLVVCLDGATEETYAKYRKKGDFERVRSGLALLCNRKQQRGLQRPEIALQFILFEHNIHETDLVREIAAEVGVDKLLFKRTSASGTPAAAGYARSEDDPHAETFLGEDRTAQAENCKTAIVLWDGTVVPCCMDVNGRVQFGNVFDEDFSTILLGDKRRSFMLDRLQHTNQFCEAIKCPIYKHDLLPMKERSNEGP